MKKIIKIKESDLVDIVKRVLSEQKNTQKNKFTELCSILFKARDISWNEGIAKTLFNNQSEINHFGAAIVNWGTKNSNYDSKLLKGSVSFIFRESKGTIASYMSPKEILGGVLNLFGGNHSQGYAQIKPETAKQYGINMSSIYGFDGSLDAVYKMLSSNYQKAKKYYNGSTITIYKNNKLLEIPAIDGDAAFHMAIASHNAGPGIINQWCETNIPGVANICSVKQRQPYKKTKPEIIAITNVSKKIHNYFPNIGNVHDYMPQFTKCYNVLTPLPMLISQSIPPIEQSSYEKYVINNPRHLDPGKI